MDVDVAIGDWLASGDGEGDDRWIAVGFCVDESGGMLWEARLEAVKPLAKSTNESNAFFGFPLLSKRSKLESGLAV